MKQLAVLVLALLLAAPAPAQGRGRHAPGEAPEPTLSVIQEADSVVIVVTWGVVFASNGEAVLQYEIDARSSTLLTAVQDYDNPDGGDRFQWASDVITNTSGSTFSYQFRVPRPACCSPLYVGVSLRAQHPNPGGNMLDGPWTNPSYPTVTIQNVPLTLPQVFPQIDTLRVPNPPPPEDQFAARVTIINGSTDTTGVPDAVELIAYVDIGDLDVDSDGLPYPNGGGAPFPHIHEAEPGEDVDCIRNTWINNGGSVSTDSCDWVHWQGNKCAGDYGCITDYCGEEDERPNSFSCIMALGG